MTLGTVDRDCHPKSILKINENFHSHINIEPPSTLWGSFGKLLAKDNLESDKSTNLQNLLLMKSKLRVGGQFATFCNDSALFVGFPAELQWDSSVLEWSAVFSLLQCSFMRQLDDRKIFTPFLLLSCVVTWWWRWWPFLSSLYGTFKL